MSFRAELGLALLLALAVAVAVVAGRGSAGARERARAHDFRTSTFVSGPDGSKALYEALARLGRPVERRRRPLFDLARDSLRRPALLAVLDPPIRLQPAELDQVVQFVRSGGEVVVAGGGGGIAACVGWGPDRVGKHFDDSIGVVAPAAGKGLSLPPVAFILTPREAEPREEAAQRLESETANAACARLVASGQDTLVRALDRRPVVLDLRYRGDGRMTLVADAGYFRNRVWRSTDVPYVVAPLLLARGRGRVSWDEYHQGFGRERSLTGAALRWLTSAPPGWAMLQLVAVALVGLAVAAIRFGPARPVIETRRRSPLEHLEALAAGLESAAGVETAVALTVSGLRRRLSRTGQGPPPAGDQAQWLAALELVLPTSRGREAVRRLQRAVHQPGGAERVLAAALAVEDVWEELHTRTTRDAS